MSIITPRERPAGPSRTMPSRNAHTRTVLVSAAAAVLVSAAASGQTPGRLILVGAPGVSGDIIAVSQMGVEVDSRGETTVVPIENIREVSFTAEPQSLKAARVAIMRGQPAQALEDLGKIEPGEMEGADQLIVDELEFVKAAALGGQAAVTGENLPAGEKAVRDYLGKHSQSHHFFLMQELLARLLARSGKYAEAAAAYAPLDRGPPAYRVRAAAGRASVFYDQKNYDEAIREYSAAAQIAGDPQDSASVAQRRSAQLGAARCLTRQGKGGDAIAAVERVVGECDADDAEVLGQAYNVLGDAQRTLGKDQEAIIAFLTVSLVHNAAAENRAEALFNLAQLWERAKSPQRAEQAKQELTSAYPDSIWTRRLTAGKGS